MRLIVSSSTSSSPGPSRRERRGDTVKSSWTRTFPSYLLLALLFLAMIAVLIGVALWIAVPVMLVIYVVIAKRVGG